MGNRVARLANLANGIAHGHSVAFFGENLQQHAFRRRIQLVVHFFRFELNDGVAAFDGIAFLLDPADDVNFRRRQAAGLWDFERGDDGSGSSAAGLSM